VPLADALEQHIEPLRGQALARFGTGGIHCKEAAPVMHEAGLQTVWQLEGDLLEYLEESGGAHFRGSRLGFEVRQGLPADLEPAPIPPPV
jgi:UPF0176 protein